VRDVHIAMAREQVHIYMGHIGVRRTDPDYYALAVMDHVLGTGPGFTSRCSKKLRDELGLCYSVSAGITASASEEPGMFTAYIGTSPEHRQRAIDGFMAEIERILDILPTGEIARKSWADFGEVIVCESYEEMLAEADRIASEHVQVMTDRDMWFRDKMTNYGALHVMTQSTGHHVVDGQDAGAYSVLNGLCSK
jgi:hypothetical protein